jgi:hypothetical protein
VLVLDQVAAKLLILPAGAEALEPQVVLEAADVSSVAAGGDDRTAYVAHRDGLLRVDLQARRAARVTTPDNLALDRIERLRWRAGMLFAITIDPDGARSVHRLTLDARGRAITEAARVDAVLAPDRPVFVTLAGDELLYVGDGAAPAADRAAGEPNRRGELSTYRVKLP